ncbi:MAG TPA: radical SAM/SPASM domain-containing protein [Eggerthellaceae bacterium]|nr:radical SAM/SPASM domain-containing protein [Eggerthellaceae bacterium]
MAELAQSAGIGLKAAGAGFNDAGEQGADLDRAQFLALKQHQLEELAAWRRRKHREPELRNLFLELTEQCNEHCLHCGSRCDGTASPQVPADKLLEILESVKQRYGTARTMLCITGGEPLLRRDLFELMEQATDMGFRWGMTTNATLITPAVAQRLADSGMCTVSVSLDGLAPAHDWFRNRQGAHDEALRGVQNLVDNGSFDHVQITTIVHKRNIADLEAMFAELEGVDIDSWRLAAIEPMGRALEHPELMLDADDHRTLLQFIREKRIDGWPLTYGCCHFLGLDLEHEVRDAYFLCTAGIYTASITATGDIVSCLDIERRPETVQGNVYRDDFLDVWENRFAFLRRDLSELTEECSACEHVDFCAGGSWHSFDFDSGHQRMCLKGTTF